MVTDRAATVIRYAVRREGEESLWSREAGGVERDDGGSAAERIGPGGGGSRVEDGGGLWWQQKGVRGLENGSGSGSKRV